MSAALKQRILVVDDEPQVLVALEDLLSPKFIVCKASSAESALNFMEREDDVAVILSDQRMPKMNGDELLAKLGALYEAKRIMVTGFADLSAVVRAVNEGQLFAYVTKPWNEEDLLLKVSKAAEQFRLTQELATERRLLEERTRVLNSVLEGMGEGVLVTDRRGKFFIFNQAARRILGADAMRSELADWSRVCGVYETDQKTPLRAEHNPLFWALSGKESEETELFVDNDAVSDASIVMTATPLRDETN